MIVFAMLGCDYPCGFLDHKDITNALPNYPTQKSKFTVELLQGKEQIAPYVPTHTQLCLESFRSWPGLYETSEKEHLEFHRPFYENAKSLFFIAKNSQGKVAGAISAMPLADEDPSLIGKFPELGIDLSKSLYVAELMVRPEFQKQDVAKLLGAEFEKFVAQKDQYQMVALYTIKRTNHLELKPKDYDDNFIDKQLTKAGFKKNEHLSIEFSWKIPGAEEVEPVLLEAWIRETQNDKKPN